MLIRLIGALHMHPWYRVAVEGTREREYMHPWYRVAVEGTRERESESQRSLLEDEEAEAWPSPGST